MTAAGVASVAPLQTTEASGEKPWSTGALPGARRRKRPLGDPRPLACTVAKAALESVLGGDSLDGYVRWVEPELMSRLRRQRSLARRAGRTGPGVVAVKRARACRVSREAAEVSIVLETGDRTRAAAMRLEEVAGRWQVVELIIG